MVWVKLLFIHKGLYQCLSTPPLIKIDRLKQGIVDYNQHAMLQIFKENSMMIKSPNDGTMSEISSSKTLKTKKSSQHEDPESIPYVP